MTTPMDGWLWTHLSLIFTGLAGLVTAVFSAALYLWQSSQLKSKKPGESLMRLPSLDALDRLHVRALVGGAGLFSMGLLSGVVWATDLRALGGLWHDPRAVLSLVTSLLCWLIIGLRLSALGRGQKIAASTLIIFLLLALTIASPYVLPGVFHGSA